MKSLTRMSHMMTNDWIQQKVKVNAMLLYPSGQMSDCFTNVNVICITQTFEFINYIGQQRQGSTAFQ